MSEALKAKGNEAFSNQKYEEAVDFFTQAIAIDPENQVLYSNRSGSFASLERYQDALVDAEKTITLKPEWSKGYSRKGAALYGLKRFEEALEAYEKGLSLDPQNQSIQNAIQDCKENLAKKSFNPFSSPDALVKLAQNPKTAHLAANPSFRAKLSAIQSNPSLLGSYIQDPDMMAALSVLLGIDIHAGPEGGSSSSTREPFNQEESAEEPKSPVVDSQKKTETMKEEVSESEAQSLREKELGNKKYKEKNFEEALCHYKTAYELNPKNVAILTNISAIYFEQQQWDQCIKQCDEAVEKGREICVDFKLIAKALARKANCLLKLGDLEQAIAVFKKSITEFRNPEIVAALKKAEKELEERKKEAYRNPQLADEERNKGNEMFKKSLWVEAMNHYNEAIRRNDSDARNFSNRAACYIKLAAFPEAFKDCERAIELDPSFVKPYIRKANILFFKKDYSTCIEVCQQVLQLDPTNEEARTQMFNANMEMNRQSETADPSQAMNDPEVQAIVSDPAMRSILEQMQSNPQALVEHMKNPSVAQKIRKLISVGIIKTR